MDKLNELLKKYHLGFLAVVISMLSVTFVVNLFLALSDGMIDANEYHNLSASANGVELFILLIVMAVLKKKG